MLSINSAWLLGSLVLGCNGLPSGSVNADLRIYPAARVFYADPFVDMHNRMKEALVLLGKPTRTVVRPPLVKISDAEIAVR